MHPVARAASVVGAVGAAGLAYASLVERNAYALRRVTVPVLSAGHRPLRVVHVSDLHLMPGQRRKAAWVAALADLRPDLVVNTGDNISHPDAIPLALEAFSAFEGVPGVFVMGSNDYFVPQPKNPFLYLLPPRPPAPSRSPRLPTEDLVKGMLDLGWTDLTNTRATLAVAGSPVEFVGVDDPHLKYDRYGLVEGPFSPEAELRVGVTHAPYQRILDAMTRDGAELVLAGHIHQSTVAERREFELASPEGEHAVVVSIAPGFGQPRPNRRGEARGLHVYEIEAEALRILTYIWREDGWGLTAVRTFPRGREPLAFER